MRTGLAGPLFWYEPGVALADVGGTFARTTHSARYYDINGVVQNVGAGTLRDGHYVTAPVSAVNPTGKLRTALVEGILKTNLALRSEDPNVASHSQFQSTLSANTDVAPNGLTTADRLFETAVTGDHHDRQNFTVTANATYSYSRFLHAGNNRTWACLIIRGGAPVTTNRCEAWFNLATGAKGSVRNIGSATGTKSFIEPLGGGWYRCTVTGAINGGITAVDGVTSTSTGDLVAGTGGSVGDATAYIIIWGEQFEDNSPFPSSYAFGATGATTQSRNPDILDFSVPAGMAAPVPLTSYMKFVELGDVALGNTRIWQIAVVGSPTPNANTIRVISDGTKYVAIAHDAADAFAAQANGQAGVQYGDVVELRLLLERDLVDATKWTMRIGQSVNGGTEVLGAKSAAFTMNTWNTAGSPKISVMSRYGIPASEVGALASLKFAYGAKSMDEMRDLQRFAVKQRDGEFVHLIELDFASGPIRLSTGAQDLDWGGFTWEAVGGALEFGGIEETADSKGQGVDINISGVDQSILAVLLGSQYRGRTAKVYRAHLDPTAGKVLDSPLLLFQGLQLSPYQVEEEQQRTGGTVKISTRLSGYFGVERVRGIQTNVVSHGHEFSGETFFQHVASIANSKVYWGTALPRVATRKGSSDRSATRT